MSSGEDRREGGCFCGAIRYQLTAPIVRTGACHCRKCQYGSGGAPNYVALVPKSGLEVTHGEPATHLSVADSGAEIARTFCATCGSPLWSDGPNVPFLAVRVGSLDERSALRPAMHIWIEEAPPWHAFEPGTPTFAKGPLG